MREHPEVIGFIGFSDKSESSTGWSLSPPRGGSGNDVLKRFSTFYEAINLE